MIELMVDGLNKTYGTHSVLRGLSFEAGSGIIGIGGPNGSGKTTLMRCLSGLARPTGGTIQWRIHDEPRTPAEITRQIGYAAPYVQLYEELTARENLEFIRNLRSGQSCEPDLLLQEQFELASFLDHLFGELSSGQQQRVKLAAAALHKPPVLCLDEPGTNLDQAGKRIVQAMAANCSGRNGMVLLASNQPRELDLCDKVIYVN